MIRVCRIVYYYFYYLICMFFLFLFFYLKYTTFILWKKKKKKKKRNNFRTLLIHVLAVTMLFRYYFSQRIPGYALLPICPERLLAAFAFIFAWFSQVPVDTLRIESFREVTRIYFAKFIMNRATYVHYLTNAQSYGANTRGSQIDDSSIENLVRWGEMPKWYLFHS